MRQHGNVVAVLPVAFVVDREEHVLFDVAEKRQITELSVNFNDRYVHLALVVKAAGIVARKAEHNALQRGQFRRLILVIYL